MGVNLDGQLYPPGANFILAPFCSVDEYLEHISNISCYTCTMFGLARQSCILRGLTSRL